MSDLTLGRDMAPKWHALVARLTEIGERYPNAALASSLAAEDMVIACAGRIGATANHIHAGYRALAC
jgi:hypothetical protein